MIFPFDFHLGNWHREILGGLISSDFMQITDLVTLAALHDQRPTGLFPMTPLEGSASLPFLTTDPVQLSSGASLGAREGKACLPKVLMIALLWLSALAMCLLQKICHGHAG